MILCYYLEDQNLTSRPNTTLKWTGMSSAHGLNQKYLPKWLRQIRSQLWLWIAGTRLNSLGAINRWDVIPDDCPLTSRTTKTKDELLKRAKEINPNPVYKLQKIADGFTKGLFHIKIFLLPVAHPELNLIEIFWSKLKRHIATTNMTFCFSSVEQLTE